jgi:hypothetical protein
MAAIYEKLAGKCPLITVRKTGPFDAQPWTGEQGKS